MSISRQALGAKTLEAMLTIALTLAVSALTSRHLTPEARGLFFLVLTWCSIAVALTSCDGLGLVLTRECSQRPNQTSRILSSGLALQALLLCACGLVFCSVFCFLPQFESYRFVLILSALVALAGSCAAMPFEALLLSENRVSAVALMRSLGQVGSFLLFMLCLSAASEKSWGATARASTGMLSALLLGLLAWKHFRPLCAKPCFTELKHLSTQTVPITLIWVATLLYVRIDTLMLEALISRESVGHYAALYQILDSLMTLSGLLMSAYFPSFSRLAIGDSQAFRKLFHDSVSLLIRWLAPLAAILALLAPEIEAALLSQRTTSGPWIVRWLMVAAIFAWLNAASGSVLIALKKQHLYTLATILSLALNIVGNFLLIPHYGAVGAAFATALTELFLVTIAWSLIYRSIGYVPFLCRAHPKH